MPDLGSRTDPYLSSGFFVEIDGITHAGFTECTGLQVETDVFQYKEGGLNDYTHKLAGRSSFSNVVLKWGIVDDQALWSWYQDVIRGKIQRKNLSIILYDSEQSEVKRWNLREAYPVKWIGPSFNAGQQQVGIETLEIAYHGFEMQ